MATIKPITGRLGHARLSHIQIKPTLNLRCTDYWWRHFVEQGRSLLTTKSGGAAYYWCTMNASTSFHANKTRTTATIIAVLLRNITRPPNELMFKNIQIKILSNIFTRIRLTSTGSNNAPSFVVADLPRAQP